MDEEAIRQQLEYWLGFQGTRSKIARYTLDLMEQNKQLRAALEAAKMPHKLVEEDHWFSCPLAGEGEGPEGNDGRCNCGADEHNRKIDRELKGAGDGKMGWILHQAIIVTTFREPAIQRAHKEAQRIFNGYVTDIVRSPNNSYYSFLIPPDGSKEGWAASDRGDEQRAEFAAWLLADRAHDEPGYFDALEITYGEIDQPQLIDLSWVEEED